MSRFSNYCQNKGIKVGVVRFEKLTRTAKEAAEALNCPVGQIAKSLIFRIKGTDTPLLVITFGANRVDEMIIKSLGFEIEKADADFVAKKTGYVIGGVPPFGFEKSIETLIDKDLLGYEEVWAAAGENNAVFKMATKKLIEITGGKLIAVQ